MNEENPTSDLSKFGYREMDMAGDLLKEYANNPPDFLGDGIKVWFNSNSGYVFLCDDDYNTAMLDDGKLKQWLNCSYCGNEGFDKSEGGDYPFKKYNGYCSAKCKRS